MEFIDGFYQNFLRFFSWEEISFLFTGTGLLVMLNLVLSEGLLSFDNALVLAVLVSHLPKDRFYKLGPFEMSIQQWGLTAGIVGAYVFRTIAINLQSGAITLALKSKSGVSSLVGFSSDYSFAAAISNELRICRKSVGAECSNYTVGTDSIEAMLFNPRGILFTYGLKSGRISVWDPTAKKNPVRIVL